LYLENGPARIPLKPSGQADRSFPVLLGTSKSIAMTLAVLSEFLLHRIIAVSRNEKPAEWTTRALLERFLNSRVHLEAAGGGIFSWKNAALRQRIPDMAIEEPL
jgi:hypothetical protein